MKQDEIDNLCAVIRYHTLTAIAGSIAEMYYGIPEELKAECRRRLPEDMLEVLDRFDELFYYCLMRRKF